jgi:hypothetical protein
MKKELDVNRRDFLKTLSGAAVAGSAFKAWCADHHADFDFLGAGASLGWKPSDPDAFYFLQASDLHMTENPDICRGAMQMKDKFMGRCFIDDINAMNNLVQKPYCFYLTGDLQSASTMNPATWPDVVKRWKHYRKYVTDRLQVPFMQIIGNNDCPAVPYKKVYPDLPLYWSSEKGGILFCGLHGYNCWKIENTNHAGIYYDDDQLEWLAKTVSSSNAKTLVLLTHEPLANSDSTLARKQLEPVLETFRGKCIWNFCGHDHSNADYKFRIGKRTVFGSRVMTPVGVGFEIGDGGFRVAYCKNGEIVGTALRWLTPDGDAIGFQPCPIPEKESILLEDSFSKDALKTILIGTDNTACPNGKNFEDRISNYALKNGTEKKPSFVRWRIPGEVQGKRVGKIELFAWGMYKGQFGLSHDGIEYARTPALKVYRKKECCNIFIVEVPPDFPPGDMFVELYNTHPGNIRIGGYALLG